MLIDALFVEIIKKRVNLNRDQFAQIFDLCIERILNHPIERKYFHVFFMRGQHIVLRLFEVLFIDKKGECNRSYHR